MSERALDPTAARARLPELAVLDVRDEAAYLSGHLERSGHVPLAEFESRRAELPPREQPVLVVADEAPRARQAASRLVALGFAQAFWLSAPLSDMEGGHESRGSATRLWRPAAFLEEVLSQIPRGRAADFAAGSGREAVFLAMNGFEVEAWDSAPEALERAQALAARHEASITAIACDLEATNPPIPASQYQVAVCFRFLHRPLLPRIARSLAPGGHLVYETYRVGQERFGRPKRPQFLLESGELRRSFAELEILRYDEPSPAGGPFTARLHARKPVASARTIHEPAAAGEI